MREVGASDGWIQASVGQVFSSWQLAKFTLYLPTISSLVKPPSYSLSAIGSIYLAYPYVIQSSTRPSELLSSRTLHNNVFLGISLTVSTLQTQPGFGDLEAQESHPRSSK